MTTTNASPDIKAPYNVTMEVTPEQAAKWLEENTKNRPLCHAHVQRLAEDMRARRWQLTHQGIAFDSNGLLLDGQHRLWAIVEAGVPITFQVFFNEPPDSRLVIDAGKRRSNLDIIALSGQIGHVSCLELATLRAMLGGHTGHSIVLTPGAEAEQFSRHREAVAFAVEHLERARLKGVCTAHVRAVVARAFYSVEQGRLAHFCDVLKSGMPAGDEDHVILTLRDFLSRNHTAGFSESAQRVRYMKTQWALRAYLDRRPVKRLGASDSELFSLPKEADCAAKVA